MNYGLYLSAAGTLSSMHRLDVMANNLANVNTAGFKPDEIYTRARLPERLESQSASGLLDPQYLLEQLGGGTLTEPSHLRMRQGDLAQSYNDLDLAIQGDGFFVVANGKPGSAADLRLTRDGRFTRNAAGELVMAATGLRVVDVNNQPIRLGAAGPVRIDAAGNITQNGQNVAQIQIATVTDKSTLAKEGHNLIRENSPRTGRTPATAAIVKQGFLESSGVDAILAMNQMINASKAVQANATMMQYHDHILGQAINTFGRVA